MKVYISQYANVHLVEYLRNHKLIVNFVKTNKVYNEISSHPDIYMCQLGDRLFHGNLDRLKFKYPGNIIFNSACTGKYFIHNLKYTNPELLKIATDMNMTLVDVKQGYAKCNIVVVNENSIITSDIGIASKCSNYMDVLLIKSGHIFLQGFNYGFIGGTCGKFKDTIIFNGNLSAHPDFNDIIKFIHDKKLKCKWFSKYPLTDIGSILFDIGGKYD